MDRPQLPPLISGHAAFLELLASEGITHMFGNPGTTELAIMEAMSKQSKIDYVLGLQESIVVGMADGYARVLSLTLFRDSPACLWRSDSPRSSVTR
jgi:glyoxylate carboligase